MTNDDALNLLRSVLHTVAPEADLDQVDESESMQEAISLQEIWNYIARKIQELF